MECLGGVTSSVSPLEYLNVVSWSPAPTSRTSGPTLTPTAMSGLCLLMRMALAAFRSASDRHFVRDRQSSCAMPRLWHRGARSNPLDLSCSDCTTEARSLVCDSHQTENTRAAHGCQAHEVLPLGAVTAVTPAWTVPLGAAMNVTPAWTVSLGAATIG